MFKFNNTHIFTGYIKQLLSTTNLPTCKIYTREFAEHLAKTHKEDPRIVESFDTINLNGNVKPSHHINYLKNDRLFNYFWDSDIIYTKSMSWKSASTDIFYEPNKFIPGLTRRLNSPGNTYDEKTHEYLGDYLRFLRDYYDVNLMSLYNCFNNKICNNITYESSDGSIIFDAQNTKYHIYAIPVKLFENYTIAIDCNQGIEVFCGLYGKTLENSNKNIDLIKRTYRKYPQTIFNQPFLYDGLSVKYWNYNTDTQIVKGPNNSSIRALFSDSTITRWDIINKEQDLRLFIKIPVSCKSSIVVLEGNFTHHNNFKYIPKKMCTEPDRTDFYMSNGSLEAFPKEPTVDSGLEIWEYKQNHSVINFPKDNASKNKLNSANFKPIGKLQLLAFNTNESYPFADRLIEYLIGSAITPLDEIPDNIKRAQAVMNQNQHYFEIPGVWENKMQKIVYDYITSSGPISVNRDKTKLVDNRHGYQPRLGHTNKSFVFDILGYVDRDAEKWYAGWTKKDNKPVIIDNIHSVDIYKTKNGNSLWDV